MSEALVLAEQGIRADAQGRVAGNKFYMEVADQGFIKPFSGFMQGEELAYVKTFNFFPQNPQRFSAPTTSSLVLLFEANTGFPVCLMEAGWITGLKTGASTAVTTAHLARPEAETLVIFGAGTQGKMHLRALAQCFSWRQIWLIDLLPAVAEDAARELTAETGLTITPAGLDQREQAVRGADVVITVTTGNDILVQREWLKPGAFVAKLGSYQELALDVISAADKVIVDCWHYVRPRIPELQQLADLGFNEAGLHAEWPDVVAGRRPGRETAQEIIVYMALGIWGEYATILPAAYRRARELGLGIELPTTQEAVIETERGQ